ncbi:hypothetical protein FXO38_06706 [Capsicum annuum]|nr:hypothetical protein FXO37_15791 [Capsicum annuum]KAF3671194.1 hypothetical protein FXO38_06706 [Capsicum annuum]
MASTTFGDEFEVDQINVILKSSDGDEFELKKSIAMKYSSTIKKMVELDVTTSIIPIPHVETENLFKMVEYLKMHGTEVSGSNDDEEIKNYDEKFATASFKSLLEIVWAAKYLEIKGLHVLCTEELAERIKGKSCWEISATYHYITAHFTSEKEKAIYKEFKWALREERSYFFSILFLIAVFLILAAVGCGVVPLHGSPILLEGSTDLGIAARRQVMHDLTGWEPALDCFCGIRRILVSKLAAYIKELDNITHDTPEIEVQQRVRLYLLWLRGGTRLSFASNYAPPTQSAESPPMQVRHQGRQSVSRDSTLQGRRGGRRADSMTDRDEEPHDNFGLSLATTIKAYYPHLNLVNPRQLSLIFHAKKQLIL